MSRLSLCAAGAIAACACSSGGGGDAGTATSTSRHGTSSTGGTGRSVSTASSTASSTGSSGSTGSTSSGSACANDCSDLQLGGGILQVEQSTAAAPLAQGGTPTAGVYNLTDVTIYSPPGGASGPSGTTLQMTLALDVGGNSGTVVQVESLNGACSTSTFSVSYSATSLTVDTTCPATCGLECQSVDSYTATDSAPPLYVVFTPLGDDAGVEVDTFTWQHD